MINQNLDSPGPGETALWLICLLCKHADQSLDPQKQCKWRLGMAVHLYHLGVESKDRIFVATWLDRIAKPASLGLKWQALPQWVRWDTMWEDSPRVYTCVNLYQDTCEPAHIRTQSHAYNRKKTHERQKKMMAFVVILGLIWYAGENTEKQVIKIWKYFNLVLTLVVNNEDYSIRLEVMK